MTYIVPAFADAYKMNVQDAFFLSEKIWRVGFSQRALVGATYRQIFLVQYVFKTGRYFKPTLQQRLDRNI